MTNVLAGGQEILYSVRSSMESKASSVEHGVLVLDAGTVDEFGNAVKKTSNGGGAWVAKACLPGFLCACSFPTAISKSTRSVSFCFVLCNIQPNNN